MDDIVIKGARENNLKNIDLTIPRNKLVVFTGLSGSGKTSLAFDTIFAEGQRRYVESLSSYARQFLGQMNKPDIDSITGLSPAISIDQKTTNRNPRSTVGTVTEIHDYLRLLYARIGVVHCPKCGKAISQQTIDQIIDRVMTMDGAKILVEAPVVRGRKGEFVKQFESYRKSGYVRVKVDGQVRSLDEDIKLDKQCKHDVSVVIDRLIVKPGIESRLTDSVETALGLADGIVIIESDGVEQLYNTKYACPDCGVSIEEIEPRLFSFNSPFGACPECSGLGYKQELDPALIVGDESKTIREGALCVTGWNLDSLGHQTALFEALAEKYGFSLDVPYRQLPEEIKQLLLYGNDGEKVKVNFNSLSFNGSYMAGWSGVVNNLMRKYSSTTSQSVKNEIEKYIRVQPCSSCHGDRLKKEALAVTVGGLNLAQLSALSISKLKQFFADLQLTDTESKISTLILREINARLDFLCNVGLDYLTLSRIAASLSGGEAQRIRLATQIGGGLSGVLYILDEPSIGLHQRDNGKLIATLEHLRDIGNTVIVVEHDEETMLAADWIVDIGPGAGVHGGKVIAQGNAQLIMQVSESITGQFLSGVRKIHIPASRRPTDKGWISIHGARQNNLKNIDVDIPIGVITAVTGVSGSGKSSLINQILSPRASNLLMGTHLLEGACDGVEGLDALDKIIVIDQTPIGRTPKSNPATYTGVFTAIRELFSRTQDAKERGYSAGRFSFNVKGGRCEHCSGDGIICIAMNFLPDVYVPCEVCHGARYNRETLQVKYKGKSISDVLEMTIEEATQFFENLPQIYNKIKMLNDVGLGYIKLGQPATTLSGGEAQRVKLATELARRSTTRTLYILDEPTTGLHMADVDKLVSIMHRLASNGNTVVVIEHNLDVIKVADYIIDLGPEGGDGGGTIIAHGTPEEVAQCENSFTGQFLNKILSKEGRL